MDLERDIFSYLSFQLELAETSDEITRQLLLEDALQIPEEYLLLRRLRIFGGNQGLPLLVEGGYFDQPYMLVQVIEACVSGEYLFEDFLKQRNDQKLRDAYEQGKSSGLFDNSNSPFLHSGR